MVTNTFLKEKMYVLTCKKNKNNPIAFTFDKNWLKFRDFNILLHFNAMVTNIKSSLHLYT
jgi:hypothetical protein